MAARAIVEERRQIAVKRIQEQAAALSGPLGIDAAGFLSPYVKGDAAYQEMVRTEQLAELLAAVRAKVAPAPEGKGSTERLTKWFGNAAKQPEPAKAPEVPLGIPAPQRATSGGETGHKHARRK